MTSQGGALVVAVAAGFLLMLVRGGRVSSDALDLIKEFEGFSSTVYRDAAGVPTIGYGHALKPGESFEEISREEAEQLLRADARDAMNAIDRLVEAPLSTHQEAALLSLVYNIGSGAFSRSTLLRRLNAGDYPGAADEFQRWVFAGGQRLAGLARRRATERSLFLTVV